MCKVKVLEIGAGNFGKGGISTAVWNWYTNFNKNLYVDFFSTILPEQKYITYINEHQGTYTYITDSRFIIRKLKEYYIVRSMVHKKKYDCIHIHASNSVQPYLLFLLVKKYCKNVFIHSHTIDVNENTIKFDFLAKAKKILHKICRYLMRNENMVYLACSIPSAEWMFAKTVIRNRKYKIIKNGINISIFSYNQKIRETIRSELKIENKFVIGHVGRFAYAKNHFFLLEIFKKVHAQQADAVLLLVGGGELEQEIKTMVHHLHLDDAVIFYGTTPNVNKLYQAMDCFVFPSHFEGLGVAAIEAQAAGLKTLCSDTIPKETQITQLLEYLSISLSPEKWAERILSYNDGYERKDMSIEIKAAGYDIIDSAKQLEELYIEYAKKKYYT